jgi:hypothetical protein
MTYNITPVNYGTDRYYKGDSNELFMKKRSDEIALLEKQIENEIQELKNEKKNILCSSGTLLDAEILSLVDKQPMTVKDMFCAFDICEYSQQQVFHERLICLLEEGFIDDITTGLFQKIANKISHQNRRRRIAALLSDQNTYFTLTTKGFFSQHPLMVSNALKK